MDNRNLESDLSGMSFTGQSSTAKIVSWLKNEVSKYSELTAEEINGSVDKSFLSLGLSSLDLVQLSSEIRRIYSVDLSPVQFFENPSIRSLAEFLAKSQVMNSYRSKSSRFELKSRAGRSESAPHGKRNNKLETAEKALDVLAMSCRFPGADSIGDFWQLIESEKRVFSSVKDKRNWLLADNISADSQQMGLIEKPFHFDASAFQMTKREAERTDPQHRLLLTLAKEVFQEAGLPAWLREKFQIGVYVGISSNDYHSVRLQSEFGDSTDETSVFDGPGMAHSMAANRISYSFDLKGPSLTIDTACSSSLVAVDHAYQAIHRGEIDMALVGGVNLLFDKKLTAGFSKAGMLSPTGEIKPFGAGADGYLRGEGAGLVLIARSGILGTKYRSKILSTAINQDGRTSSLTAPRPQSQVEVIQDCLDRAGVQPHQVNYVEAHGTGTELGDPIECSSLIKAYRPENNSLTSLNHSNLNIGAVKSNIGHLEAAAGVAGLIKSILCLENKKFPGIAGFQSVNPHIRDVDKVSFTGSSISTGSKNFIGLSSFGFGGTNSHVLLGAGPISSLDQDDSKLDTQSKKKGMHLAAFVPGLGTRPIGTTDAVTPVLVGANNKNDLQKNLESVLEALESGVNINIERYSQVLLRRIEPNDFFVSFFVSSFRELKNQLQELRSRFEKGIIEDEEIGIFSEQILEKLKIEVDLSLSDDDYAPPINCQLTEEAIGDLGNRLNSDDKLEIIHRKSEMNSETATLLHRDPSEIEAEIRDIIHSELGLESIDKTESLINLGEDSLTLLDLLEIINDEFDVEIKIPQIFSELNTLEKIVKFISNAQIPSQNAVVEKAVGESVVEISNSGDSGQKIGVLDTFSTRHHTKTQVTENLDRNKKQDEVLQDYISKFVQDFSNKTPESKKLAQNYRTFLADNRVSAGFRPQLKETTYPIVFERAKGSRFVDIDGNEYVDLTMGFGVNLFGHSPGFVMDRVARQLDQGVAVGPQSRLAGQVAEKICLATQTERCSFQNSGTESIMTAVRLARAAHRKDKIIVFEGSYHGHFDGVLGRSRVSSNGDRLSTPVAPGIPKSIEQDLIVLKYNDKKSLRIIENLGDRVSAVLVEPVQSRYPSQLPGEFLKQLRTVCTQKQICLIFDEVITGFRIRPGGAQEYFDVQADICCFGKVIGGGFPIGVVAGKKEYLDFIDGGDDWRFGDESVPLNEMTFFAGTFCKHPVAMIAADAILDQISASPAIYSELNSKTERLIQGLNQIFDESQVEIKAINFGSLFRFEFKKNIDLFFLQLNYRGLYIWEGRNCFLSVDHSNEDIKKVLSTVREVVEELDQLGYLPKKKIENNEILLPSEKRFQNLIDSNRPNSKLAAQIFLRGTFEGDIDIVALKRSLRDSFKTIDHSDKYLNPVREVRIDNNSQYLEEISKRVLDSEINPLEVYLISTRQDSENTNHLELVLVASHLKFDGLSLAMFMEQVVKVYHGHSIGGTISFELFKESQSKRSERKLENLNSSESFEGKRKHIPLDATQVKRFLKVCREKNESSSLHFLRQVGDLIAGQVIDGIETIGFSMAGHEDLTKPMFGNCVTLATASIKDILDAPDTKKFRNQIIANALDTNLNESIYADVVVNVEPVSDSIHFGESVFKLTEFSVRASEFPISLNLSLFDVSERSEEDSCYGVLEVDYQTARFSNEQIQRFIDSLVEATF